MIVMMMMLMLEMVMIFIRMTDDWLLIMKWNCYVSYFVGCIFLHRFVLKLKPERLKIRTSCCLIYPYIDSHFHVDEQNAAVPAQPRISSGPASHITQPWCIPAVPEGAWRTDQCGVSQCRMCRGGACRSSSLCHLQRGLWPGLFLHLKLRKDM